MGWGRAVDWYRRHQHSIQNVAKEPGSLHNGRRSCFSVLRLHVSHFESPVLLFAKGSVESTRKVPTYVRCELGVELNIGCEFIMIEDSPRARGGNRV